MYEVFTKLLNMSLTASILVLLVIILRIALKKAPKKYICILWALVAIRLICPFSISSSLSAYNVLHKDTISSGQIEYFEYNGKTEKPELTFEVPALVNDNYSPDSMTIGTKTSGVYMPTVVYIWVFGVILMLGYAVVSYVRLRKEVKASIKKDDNIYVCDEINSPFILGIIRPRIYLPSGMSEEVSVNVVAHEKAHIKRLDYLWKPLGFILLSIYWFNPVMWVAYVLLCKDIEAACDEKVIAQMDKEHIASYSQALLVCAAQRKMITACPIAFGETDVKGRIKNVLSYKKPAFWIICISVIACIIVAVCFLTNPEEKKNNFEVTIGLYTNNDINEDPMLYTSGLGINEDGTFSFSPSVISSYLGTGTWETDGEYIIFNDRGMGDNRKIVFLFDDGKLFFDADRSDSNSMWGLSDGAEFIYRDKTSLLEYLVNNTEGEEETNTEISETVEPQHSEYQGIETDLFKEMSGEYWMLSGAGGWQSRIYLYSDGYFVGIFEDSDAGSVERCEFSGYFEYPVDLSETAYVTHIGELVYEEPGKISEEDGISVTTVTPYGFDGASTTYIYAPGYPISSLSNIEYAWLSAEREEFWDKSYAKAQDDVLPCFAIRNINANNLSEVDYMFTKVPERYQSDLGSKRNAGTGYTISYSEYTYDLILNFGGRFYLSDAYEEPIHGEGAPEGWYALGGEGECIDPSYAEREKFVDGKLIEYTWLDNHSDNRKIMPFSVGDYSCCLYQYSFDLLTVPELEQYPDADPTSEYWVVFYTEGEGKPLYVKYFSCNYFSREQAMESIVPGLAIIYGADNVEENLGVDYREDPITHDYIVDRDMVFMYKKILEGEDATGRYPYRYIVLTNDENITWESVNKGLFSNNSEDWLTGTVIIGLSSKPQLVNQ